METENLERQIPLILYRLDTTAQVLEEIKEVLDKQTENLTSLLVLQEKHSHLQVLVNDIKQDIERIKPTIEKNSSFVEKFYGGLYVGLFVFGILQSIIFWWVGDTRTQIQNLTDQGTKNSNRIEILERVQK